MLELGLSCSMWTVSCGMWDLVLWPGNEPRTLALRATVLPIGPPQKSHFRDSLNGGFTKWTSLIINSIFRSSPLARRQGVGLKVPSIESWPPLFSDQSPHRSPHRIPPRVTSLEQKMLQNPENSKGFRSSVWDTPVILITQDIIRILGALVQERVAETNTYFLLWHGDL